ncbi:hypothetical protein QO179_05485 [Bacillus stercoris]|nr:hypothetical protein [Bacillus stercoris]
MSLNAGEVSSASCRRNFSKSERTDGVRLETGDRTWRRPEITNMLKRLNIKTEFSGGQRKTTKPVLEVAEMVLSGSVNKFFVAELAKHGLRAAGISGKDGGLLEADYLDSKAYGEVGEIKKSMRPW